ncbi:sigma 54-interacting transcriptional regulator [Terrilactibacillus sp. S3-3]|nr:sigma 54-interacting transcriptional regulator [Terrilactibacillus sp. S3-3]
MPVELRIIAATNRDLEKMIADGHFRPDLYYRLNVVSITIPPLRERIEDIPELVQIYLNDFSLKYKKKTGSRSRSGSDVSVFKISVAGQYPPAAQHNRKSGDLGRS